MVPGVSGLIPKIRFNLARTPVILYFTENKNSISIFLEQKTFELLFRNKKHFAVAHNCSVGWSKKEISNCVEYVETTFLPRYEIQDIKPRIDESLKLANNFKKLFKKFFNYWLDLIFILLD